MSDVSLFMAGMGVFILALSVLAIIADAIWPDEVHHDARRRNQAHRRRWWE